jgi:penicillin amidase
MFKVLNNAPLVSRTLAFIVFPLFLIFFVTYYFYIRSALPMLNGEQYVSGLNQDVKISRDEYGVVYINASSDDDVYFAMGYAHAQDRLWQLELQRRLSQGTMAEVFGEEAVNSDIWMRTLGIYESAIDTKKHLSNEAKKSLQAYSEGINAWLKSGNQLPLEFGIFGIDFVDWKIEDSLAWQKIFALNLSGNYKYELLKYVGRQYLSKSTFDVLFESKVNGYKPLNIAPQLPILPLTQLIDLQNHLEQNLKVGGEYVGSNAFVISGEHTQSGFPILANDPHLAIQIPSLWYAVSQRGDKLRSRGFSLVGLPVVIFGRNENVAWGGTNMMADVQDLVIETSNPEDPKQYLHQQEWKNFETRVEKIGVKAQFPSYLRPVYEPIEIVVRKSVHGPVISDAIQGFEQAVALKWVALAEKDKSYESFFLANYASNLAEFRASFVDYVAPALNLMYADRDNNIAMLGIGKIPLRTEGNGTLPRAAKGSGKQWQGYIPFSDMPFMLNPASGFIVNANNASIEPDYPYLISTEFAPAYRANRISDLLAGNLRNEKIAITDTFKIMADVKDTAAQNLLSQLVKVIPKNKLQIRALEYLQGWDYVASEEQIAPGIYYRWVRHIKQSLFPETYVSVWSQKVRSTYMKNIDALLSDKRLIELMLSDEQWCQLNGKSRSDGCQMFLLESLDEALDELIKLKGSSMENWQWGELQTTIYAHRPFSEIESIKPIFERKYAPAGSPNTINVSSGYFDKSKGYVTNFGAGFRQAMGLSNISSHYLMNSTGQSGQVASDHYDDMVMPFKNVSMHDIDNVNKSVTDFYLKTIPDGERQ